MSPLLLCHLLLCSHGGASHCDQAFWQACGVQQNCCTTYSQAKEAMRSSHGCAPILHRESVVGYLKSQTDASCAVGIGVGIVC